MTVLRARADLHGKQVFNCTNNYNIVVYLYCYLDAICCSWIVINYYFYSIFGGGL